MSENPKIEWENHISSLTNRGTDGFGLIVQQDVIGRKSRIVRLEFRLYIEDNVDLSGDRLRCISQEIGDLLHERLS